MSEISADDLSALDLARALHGYRQAGPLSGVASEFVFDEATGAAAARYTQRVDPIIDHNTRARNDFARARSAGLDDSGILMLANVPVTIIDQIRERYGVDAMKDEDMAAFLGIIERDYPALKAVNMDISKLA